MGTSEGADISEAKKMPGNSPHVSEYGARAQRSSLGERQCRGDAARAAGQFRLKDWVLGHGQTHLKGPKSGQEAGDV